MMDIFFPHNPMMRKLPEPMFEPEFDAARALGFGCFLLDGDALLADDVEGALKRLPERAVQPAIYRGWILTEELYRRFHAALAAKGYALVTSPEHYAEVVYFPNYYPKIRTLSPRAVWTDTADAYRAWALSRSLGDGPFVLKDHVKSAKHRWDDACFVPSNAGRESFERIAKNLIREQGKLFFRGLVVKEYVPLRKLGESPWEYPMCEEYRLFFWHGRLLIATHYHRQPANAVDWSPFVEAAQRFDAPFFTMDVAQTEADNWIVVDMGSGECSALPPSLEASRFYTQLAETMRESSVVL
jgi:hypothetical protein